jgi:hypothetical protein
MTSTNVVPAAIEEFLWKQDTDGYASFSIPGSPVKKRLFLLRSS